MQLTEYERAAFHKARVIAQQLASWAKRNDRPDVHAKADNVAQEIESLVEEVEAADLEFMEAPF